MPYECDVTVTLDPYACSLLQAKMVQSKKARGGQEIPVPKVRRVETYTRDYLPIFQEHNTYLRGRGVSLHLCFFPVGLHCACDSFTHL